MRESALLQPTLRGLVAALPTRATDRNAAAAVNLTRRIEAQLSLPAPGGGPAPATTAPAFVLVAPPLAEAAKIVLAAILALLVYLLHKLLGQALGGALRALIDICRKALERITQAREQVKELERTAPNAPNCGPKFDEVTRILNQMATRLNSPVAAQPNMAFLRGLVELANQLMEAMRELLACADPKDSMGLMKGFFGRDGLIMQALKYVKALIGLR